MWLGGSCININICMYVCMDHRYQLEKKLLLQKSKGGFPVMAETTRNHIFSKEISQVIIAAMVLAPNFY